MALFSTPSSASGAVAGFANGLADLTVRTLGGGAPGPPAPAVDPLLDLRLPESVREWLKPATDALGLAFVDGEVPGKYGAPTRRVTYLPMGAGRLTVLHIDPKVLTDENAFQQLHLITWALDEKGSVIVVGTDVTAPALANATVIEGMWPDERVKSSRFINWNYLKQLPKLDLARQIEFMRIYLGIDTETQLALAQARNASTGELGLTDINKIIEILSTLEHFNNTHGRRTLLMQAELTAIADIDLEGAPNEFGWRLVGRLTKVQARMPRYNYTALGALLRTAMSMPDINDEDANWLKALITRCAL